MWQVTREPGKEDVEFQLRQMMRWYAHYFNYRLHEVEEIPIEHVAMHYWEHHYQQMRPEDQEEEIKLLTQTEEEAKASRDADDEFLAKTIKDARAASKDIRKEANLLKKAGKGEEAAPVIPVPVMGQNQPTTFAESLKEEMAKPEINMSFISKEEMDDMGDWDMFGTKPKK